MIRDHNQLSLDVTVDDTVTGADVSVSLGLIVTELVINALKHAFPEDRGGKIKVDYHSHGPNWALSVADNGVGMPTGAASAKPGLGTVSYTHLQKVLVRIWKRHRRHPFRSPGLLCIHCLTERPTAHRLSVLPISFFRTRK